MIEPLNAEKYETGDGFLMLADMANKLNELIAAYNELEMRYGSHTHGSSELLHHTYAAQDNVEPVEVAHE